VIGLIFLKLKMFPQAKIYFKRFDWILFISVLALSSVGLISLRSTAQLSGDFSSFEKQLLFLIIGVLFLFAFSLIDIKAFKESSLFIIILYFVFSLLLFLLFFFGVEKGGAGRWFQVGDFLFQPSEFMKFVFVLFFAKFFSERHIELYLPRHIIISMIYMGFPAILVFMQPDFGSAIILVSIWLGILLISGIKRKHIAIIFISGFILFFILWNFFLEDFQKNRVFSFLNPNMDLSGINYQANQALITVGSGGFWGKGFGQGTQVQYGFLPGGKTDFIFAAICEDFGVFGGSILIIFYIVLFWRLTSIILKIHEDNFSKLFISGVLVLISIQSFINLAMNLNLLPITGIPLPFVSYGGSNLIALLMLIGLVESIRVYQR